jgi:ribosomal protein S18 acetylase RimI-like enzyme
VRCIAESLPPPGTATLPGAYRPPVRYREFAPGDIPVVTEIVAESLRERYEPSLYLTLSQQWPEGFLVATDERDRPIGFLLAVVQVEHEGRILMFAVEKGRRTQGIGAELMRRFLERSLARGLRRATLEVRVSNATAIRFYTQHRFAVVDLLRGYYSDGENGYQMVRELA